MSAVDRRFPPKRSGQSPRPLTLPLPALRGEGKKGAASRVDNGFLKIANRATLLFVALRPHRLADGPGRGSWDEDRRKKFGAQRKGPWRPCKPLISHKMAKGFFGNVWRKRPKIWKGLAWIWKSAPSPRSRQGKKLVVERVPLASSRGQRHRAAAEAVGVCRGRAAPLDRRFGRRRGACSRSKGRRNGRMRREAAGTRSCGRRGLPGVCDNSPLNRMRASPGSAISAD